MTHAEGKCRVIDGGLYRQISTPARFYHAHHKIHSGEYYAPIDLTDPANAKWQEAWEKTNDAVPCPHCDKNWDEAKCTCYDKSRIDDGPYRRVKRECEVCKGTYEYDERGTRKPPCPVCANNVEPEFVYVLERTEND
jgi:hypothetical protein